MEHGLALALATVLDLAVSVGYAYAGLSITRRLRAPDGRAAIAMFATWWYGIAVTGATSIVTKHLAWGGAAPWIVDALDLVTLLAYATALVGFTSYLAFLFLGTHRLAPFIAGTYAALCAWTVGFAILHPASSYHFEAWRPIMERGAAGGPTPAVMAILLVLPVVAGTLALGVLRARTRDKDARYRLLLVTGSLVAWLVGVAIVSLPPIANATGAQVGGRLAVLASAATIVLAYKPPDLIRSWLGHEDAEREMRERSAKLHARVRELV